MIIKMKEGTSKKDIDYVISRVISLGLRTHITQDGKRTMISLIGDLRSLPIDALSGLRGVEQVLAMEHAFRLASRDYKSTNTLIQIDNITIGGDQIVVMAGPCAVESRKQLLETARAVQKSGAKLLRGGAFKPRTSPYSFQGLGEAGLEILAEAREETGLKIITEVMSIDQVPLVSKYADILQIGARNMMNYPLLHAIGESGKPTLLKRGMMSPIREFLMSAEYILASGNQNLMLCERGIRTFETLTRNTMDISAIPLLKELTHLPIIADPSHATGKASLVDAVSRASIAAGADGLIVEVHIDPERALSDGYQSLNPDQFARLMTDISRIADAVERTL